MKADGTGLRQLTDDPFKDRNMGFTPDGQRIFFMSDRGGAYETWSIRPDGSGLERVTSNSKRGVWWPAFSPDGSVFVAPDGLNSYLIHLGSPPGATRVEPLPPLNDGDFWFDAFDWSADGKSIVGSRGRGSDQFGVVLYDVAARRFERLNEKGWGPRFLPDGRRILFSDRSSVFLIDSATKKEHLILPAPTEAFLIWFVPAPDGKSIYTLRQLTESDIWMADLK